MFYLSFSRDVVVAIINVIDLLFFSLCSRNTDRMTDSRRVNVQT